MPAQRSERGDDCERDEERRPGLRREQPGADQQLQYREVDDVGSVGEVAVARGNAVAAPITSTPCASGSSSSVSAGWAIHALAKYAASAAQASAGQRPCSRSPSKYSPAPARK
jgi:hypothetical protein